MIIYISQGADLRIANKNNAPNVGERWANCKDAEPASTQRHDKSGHTVCDIMEERTAVESKTVYAVCYIEVMTQYISECGYGVTGHRCRLNFDLAA